MGIKSKNKEYWVSVFKKCCVDCLQRTTKNLQTKNWLIWGKRFILLLTKL